MQGRPGRKIPAGASGLGSTINDYYRFCEMLRNSGTLDGVHVLGRRTVGLMTANHLPGGRDVRALSTAQVFELPAPGVGFGLGFSVVMDPAAGLVRAACFDSFSCFSLASCAIKSRGYF